MKLKHKTKSEAVFKVEGKRVFFKDGFAEVDQKTASQLTKRPEIEAEQKPKPSQPENQNDGR